MFKRWFEQRNGKQKSNSKNGNDRHRDGNGSLVDLSQVIKTYETEAGAFIALNRVDLQVGTGEFVAVIGKSGSGKSTLINMIAGIDRPTSGQVLVGGAPVHTFGEGKMAQWRGRHIGVIFQFFQLLPTLTVVENVMLPMDFCHMYSPREREERSLHLLEQVDMVWPMNRLSSWLTSRPVISIRARPILFFSFLKNW
jgi:putative ABC transport system ATP-binding protein